MYAWTNKQSTFEFAEKKTEYMNEVLENRLTCKLYILKIIILSKA